MNFNNIFLIFHFYILLEFVDIMSLKRYISIVYSIAFYITFQEYINIIRFIAFNIKYVLHFF